MPRWVYLRLAILSLLASPVPALAADKDLELPPPDPPGHVRHMTANPATTTSRCVGSTRTPLCAIETVMACQVRSDEALCRAGFIPDIDWTNLSISRHPFSEITYSFDWAERMLTANYELPNRRSIKVDLHAGDIMIAIEATGCLPHDCNPGCELKSDSPRLYVVREIQGAWRVVGWEQVFY